MINIAQFIFPEIQSNFLWRDTQLQSFVQKLCSTGNSSLYFYTFCPIMPH